MTAHRGERPADDAPGAASPRDWGCEKIVADRFSGLLDELEMTRHELVWHHASLEAAVAQLEEGRATDRSSALAC